jgi:hypothetical protein
VKLVGAGRPASRAADTEAELVARLTTLARALDGEPDPGWENRTRARLVAMAAVRTPEPERASPLRRLLARREGRPAVWRTRLTAGLAGAAAVVLVAAAVVTLSADARPGDALYGFKRGTEQTQLALAGDARGRTLLGFASTRLEELSAVLPEDPSADLVDGTLATMDAQTSEGATWLTRRALDTGSSAPLEELAGWTAAQAAALDDVRSAVPAAAADDAAASADLLLRVDERAAALRLAFDCPAGPATDGSDALGPVPVPCAAPAPPVGGDAPGSAAPEPPATDPGTPDLPDPGLPTLFPGPEGTVRPPIPGAAGGSPASRIPSPDLDVCLGDLPVLGDC